MDLRERCEREYNTRVVDIADVTGYSVSYVSLILSGKREAPAHVKIAIARALNARVRDLFPPPRQGAISA